MRHLRDLVKVVAHNKEELADDDTNEQESRSDLERDNLDVELYQADSSSPIKRLPCITHAHASTPTGDRGLNFSAESPVEWNDGLIFLGQQRGLDTREGDLGREDDGKDDEQAHKATDKELAYVTSTNCGIDGAEVSGIFSVAVKAIEVEHRSGDVQGELLSSGPDSRRSQDPKVGLAVRDSLVPFLGAGVADDDVRPGHVKTSNDGVEQDGEKELCHGGGGAADVEVVGEDVEEIVDYCEAKTAEVSPWASLGTEMLDCCADFGGDWLSLDEEEFWLGGSRLLGWLLVGGQERCVGLVGLGCIDCEGGCGRGFDHCERGYNGAIDVFNLSDRSQSTKLVKVF